MSLTVVAECLAAPGREDELRTALEAMIEPSLEEAGCLAYRPYVDPNEPARMVIVEEWTGPQALAEHFATEHFRQVRSTLDRVLAEPLTIRRLVPAAGADGAEPSAGDVPSDGAEPSAGDAPSARTGPVPGA